MGKSPNKLGIGDYKGKGKFELDSSEFYGYGNQKRKEGMPYDSPINQGISSQVAEQTCAAYGPAWNEEDDDTRANLTKSPDFKNGPNAVDQGLGFPIS